MKYLLLKKSRYSLGYELQEFDTPQELTTTLMEDGLSEDVIVAQRVGVQMQICEWAKPEAKPQEDLLQEAA